MMPLPWTFLACILCLLAQAKLSWEVMTISGVVHPIRKDYLSGMSFTAIGEKYSIDPRTAKRYAMNNLPLEQLENRPFSSILDPYKHLIDQWLLNGRIFASLIHDRLKEQGCECGYTTVNDYVRKKIGEYEELRIYESYRRAVTENISRKDKIMIEKQRMRGK